MMRRLALVAALLFALHAPARAEPEAAPARHWYGWQVLLCDGASAALIAAGFAADNEAIFAGLALWAVGGPAVHAWHGRLGIAALSLGLHVGLPFAGLAITGDCSSSDPGCNRRAALGFLGGALVSALVDGPLLGWERTAPADDAIAPALLITPGGAALGLRGGF